MLLAGSETNEFSSYFSAFLAVYKKFICIVSFFYLFDGIQVIVITINLQSQTCNHEQHILM